MALRIKQTSGNESLGQIGIDVPFYRVNAALNQLLLPSPDATGNAPTDGATEYEAICNYVGTPTIVKQDDGTSKISMDLMVVSEKILDLLEQFEATETTSREGEKMGDGSGFGGSAGVNSDENLLINIPLGEDSEDNTKALHLVAVGVFTSATALEISQDRSKPSRWKAEFQTKKPTADITYHDILTPFFSVLNSDYVDTASIVTNKILAKDSGKILYYLPKVA